MPTKQEARDLAFSSPASFAAVANAALVWEADEARSFLEVEVTFRMHVGTLAGTPPNSAGYMSIVDLRSVDANVRLAYTQGAPINGAQRTGYILQTSRCQGSCSANASPITTPPPTNTWVLTRMLWRSDGHVTISFDGARASRVRLDVDEDRRERWSSQRASSPVAARHGIDDLVVSVRR